MKLRNFKGSRDYLPNEMRRRHTMIQSLKLVFEQFGFGAVETPAIEYLDTLLGKYGEDAERLIYRLAYKNGNEAALRYDLTMPLVRFIHQHRSELDFPFKRYQIQPVWRADSPQPNQGRYREFYQCDVDIIGSSTLAADTEIALLLYHAFQRLDVGNFAFRVNHRQLLGALLKKFDIPMHSEMNLYRSIDKLDKLSRQSVFDELKAKGFRPDVVDEILDLFLQKQSNQEIMTTLKYIFRSEKEVLELIDEIDLFFNRLIRLGVPEKYLQLDLTLVRGLDYYTGLIYEVVSLDLQHMGSLGGGGRYDTLIQSLSSSCNYPGVGATVGLDRVSTLIEQKNHDATKYVRSADVCVALFDDSETLLQESFVLSAQLRQNGLNVNMMTEPIKLNKQFRYADKNTIPLVVLIGPEEYEKQQVTVKNLRLHQQTNIARDALLLFLQDQLKQL